MQLGSPEVCHDTFWDVYSWLREGVDSELLIQSCNGMLEAHASSDELDPDVEPELPFNHLRACEFGVDWIPAAQPCEGEADLFIYLLSFLVLIFPLSLVLPHRRTPRRSNGYGHLGCTLHKYSRPLRSRSCG
jgi:hypothetical protein